MAKKQKIEKSSKSKELKMTYPDTAGIDVGKDLFQVCVPADRAEINNRCFHGFTSDLKAICTWLKSCSVRRVVMESTGFYWLQLFMMLQDEGIDALLVNAKAVKNMNGRKSDFSDAEWLQFLGAYDLITPCFQPSSLTRRVRTLVRGRENVVRDMSALIMRMQKSMELMNIKLSSVIKDITGKSGISIIKAILSGERNPERLADLADYRCKKSKSEIAEALHGTWDPEHMFELEVNLEAYGDAVRRLTKYDETLDSLTQTMVSELSEKSRDLSLERVGKRVDKKNQTSVDVERYAFDAWGVNVLAIPGISRLGVLCLLSELGPNFIGRFRSAAHFCSWCNLTPDNECTGGKIIKSSVKRKKSKVGQVFREAAMSMAKSKSPLGDFYRRIRARSGGLAANVATAHKMAKIFYTMIQTGNQYEEKKVAMNEKDLILKKIERLKKKAQSLERMLG